MLTCKDASHLLSERLERKLSRRERWSLRLHLWICANCRRFERHLALLRRALRQLGEADAAGGDLPVDARNRIRHALAERNRR
jgi:predicted anti-sigma-YlaC factor YlaD